MILFKKLLASYKAAMEKEKELAEIRKISKIDYRISQEFMIMNKYQK